jgi:ferric-dicitrate binding protein FerR (iron transport regulator)
MQIDKAIIEKFLNNRCNAEEAKQVHRYLQDHPEILQEWFQHDWKQAAEEGPVNSYFAADMYRTIDESIHAQKPGLLRSMHWATAAAVIVVAFSIWMYLPEQKDPVTTEQVAAIKKETTVQLPQEPWQQHQNNSGSKQKLKLPDGSAVLLAPSATLKFKPGFDKEKREMFLEGEALFEVEKDKTRPFIVYTGSLSTTALGTSFKIITNAATVRVQLLTGKVVVKAIKKALPGWKKDVYLLPGQQLNYDAASSLVNISGPDMEKKKEMAASVREIILAEQMVFDNTPLQEVLNKLAKHHTVVIAYDPEDLDDLGFTGTIFYKDSLPVILQAIAQMNGLLLTTVPGGFSIRKAPEE